MKSKNLPVIALTYLASDGAPQEVQGWKSSHAMGIFQRAVNSYASVMLLPGLVIEDGFETRDQAHAFNGEIERICEVGVIDLEDFFTSVGGREAARKVVEKVKRRVME